MRFPITHHILLHSFVSFFVHSVTHNSWLLQNNTTAVAATGDTTDAAAMTIYFWRPRELRRMFMAALSACRNNQTQYLQYGSS
jgi:hypothetical protein